MKRLVYALLFLAVMVIGLTFAARNPQRVEVNWYFGIDYQLPLTLMLFSVLALGLFCGYLMGRIRGRRRGAGRQTSTAPGTRIALPGKG